MGTHYETLGVATDATSAQIRKAYHNLALANHPDRVGTQGSEKMKGINAAYGILSDPQRRQLYDRFGDMPDMIGDSPMVSVITSVGFMAFMFLFVISTFLLMCGLIILVACVAAKVDGGSFSWTAAMAGAWIIDIIMALFVIAFLLGSTIFALTAHPDIPTFIKVLYLACMIIAPAILILNIVFSILVAVALEGSSLSAMNVFVPEIISCSIITIIALISSLFQSTDGAPIAASVIRRVSNVLLSGLFLAFAILIPLKIDEHIDVSWPVVFIPLFLWFAVLFFRPAALALIISEGRVFRSTVCFNIFVIGGFVTSAILVSLKLEGSLDAKLGLCLIPVYIILGIMWFGLCCGCGVVLVMFSGKEGFGNEYGNNDSNGNNGNDEDGNNNNNNNDQNNNNNNNNNNRGTDNNLSVID